MSSFFFLYPWKLQGKCSRFLFANLREFPKTDSVCVTFLFLVSFHSFLRLHIPDCFMSWELWNQLQWICTGDWMHNQQPGLSLVVFDLALMSFFPDTRAAQGHLGGNGVCGWEGNSTVLTLSLCSETRRMRSHTSPRWNHHWQDALFLQ